ncbi:NAD-dependent epimerase/dehydratase family protein [Endomicrobium proavitum]|uniref:NAD-dependent epimerase/dehydratase n=1 Tax=Endomicrobium proavitum TaxID=1408281 RepID=A0A0G3WIJ3_9BACT|nr:NAD-dependent epimerase/dehydratase family protein [Endomicrobium proavitum]AKL97710.1 NAD-dependent epimerase/dehydratase [Endomicrobium proavitum]
MKTILTGATGFLGSEILKVLLRENHNIIILKRTFSNTQKIKNELSAVRQYDIDKTSLASIFEENKNIDAIIHTATCYGRKNETASQIFYSNTAFPLELLELSVKNKVKTFINTGTILPLAKKGQMHNYVLSKQQFAKWGEYYSQDIQFTNAILDYIYGPFDDKTKFLPTLIEACVENKESINLSGGEQLRDFIYIEDVVTAYMKILHLQNAPLEVEIGHGLQTSLKNAALKIKELTKSKTNLNFGAIEYKDGEPMSLKTNPAFLNSAGWKPKYNFTDGIKKLISEEYKK